MQWIVAIVAGPLIAVVGAWLLHRQSRVAAGRAAARLIEDEFSSAMSLVETSLQTGVWMDSPTSVSTAAWEAHRAAMAEAPGFGGWYAVTSTADSIRDIRQRASRGGARKGDGVGGGELPEEFLLFCLIDSEIALEALRAYAKTRGYKSERVAELQSLLNEITAHFSEATFEPRPRNRDDRRRAKRRVGRRGRGKKN